MRDVLSNHCTYCSDTPLRINILNPTMEVWFRCFFPIRWFFGDIHLVNGINYQPQPSTVSLSQPRSVCNYMDNASSLLFILLYLYILWSYILLSMLAICRDCHLFLHRSIITVQGVNIVTSWELTYHGESCDQFQIRTADSTRGFSIHFVNRVKSWLSKKMAFQITHCQALHEKEPNLLHSESNELLDRDF